MVVPHGVYLLDEDELLSYPPISSCLKSLANRYPQVINRRQDTSQRSIKAQVKYTDRLEKLTAIMNSTFGVNRPHEMMVKTDITDDISRTNDRPIDKSADIKNEGEKDIRLEEPLVNEEREKRDKKKTGNL